MARHDSGLEPTKLHQIPDPEKDYLDIPNTRALGPAGTCVIWECCALARYWKKYE